MQCRKFELIPTKIFQVMAILKTSHFLKNIPCTIIAHAFFQKMAPKLRPIFITFSNTY